MLRSRVIAVLASTTLVVGFQVFVGQAPPAAATSITVNTASDPAVDVNTGHFPDDGLCSLRAAIQAAQFDSNASDVNCGTGVPDFLDSIHINANLAGQTLTLLHGPFDIIEGDSEPIEIIGPTTNAADFAISGNNATRIFLFGLTASGDTPTTRATVKLANLTVKNGNGTGGGAFYPNGDGGAAVLAAGSHLTLDNVVFRDNTASGSARGGAIYADNATITNNGGAYISNHASGNGGTGAGGGRGGAVAFINAASRLDGYAVLMEGNTASYAGGAIAAMTGNDSAVFHLERGLLKDNTATVGGVYWTESGLAGPAIELWDSTATGNVGHQGGGVFFAVSSNQQFSYLRDTFVNNTADVDTNGGLFFAGKGFVANSIIKDSSCHNVGNIALITGTGNLSGGTNTGCQIGGAGVTGLDSTLAQNGGPEVQRTFRLISGSNAIDSGDSNYCGTIDARSLPRGTDGNGVLNNPAAGDCDVGAYEFVKYVVNFQTGTTSTSEAGGTAHIQVKLTIPDPADRPLPSAFTVNIARDHASTARANIDYTIPSPSAVTFPAGAGASGVATQNFDVAILQDNFAEANGEQVIWNITSAPGLGVAEPKSHHMTIQDDDQAGFIKIDGGNGTTVSEATVATGDTFDIRLRSQPDYTNQDPNNPDVNGPLADVDAVITPDRDCTVDVDGHTASEAAPYTYTILNANWQTPKTLTVHAVDDLYDEDFRDESTPHTCVITFTFHSGDIVYDHTTDAYNVSVIDNDVAGVTISPLAHGNQLVEGGVTDSYTVVLDTPPDPGKPLPGTPRLPTTVSSDPDAQCDTGSGGGAPKVLSFGGATGGAWNVPQTITVSAVDDPTVELLHSCTVANIVGGGDPIYANLSAAPPFAKTPIGETLPIQDYDPPNSILNDPPQVNINTGDGLHVTEAAASVPDTFTVVLERQPLTDSVTVNFDVSTLSTIPDAQLLMRKTATPAAIPGSSVPLTFTPANWNVPQSISIFAGDDAYDEAPPYDVPVHIAATISSTAVGFDSTVLRQFSLNGAAPVLDAIDLPVTVDDDDVSSIVLSPDAASLAVAESGPADTYTVQLGSHPYDDVTVTVQPTSTQCSVNGGAAGSAAVLTFLASAWNTPQTVSVTAVDDSDVETPPQTCTLTHTAASAGDTLYDGLAGADASVTVTDNDIPVLITDSPVNVVEGGATDTYSVVLGAQPVDNVIVHATVTDAQTTLGAGLTALDLTFTSANWDTPKTVTVTAVDDADREGPHSGAINHTATTAGSGYTLSPIFTVDGISGSTVAAAIADNDAPDLALSVSEVDPTAVPGTMHQYSLTLTNLTSGAPATGVVGTATVPPGTTFDATDSDTGWSCPADTAGSACTLTIGDLSSGPGTTALFAVTVAGHHDAGVDNLSLVAAVADDGASGTEAVTSNNGVTHLTPLDAAPDLGVTIVTPFLMATTGSVVSYAVGWSNVGSQDATGTVVSATVPVDSTFSGTFSDPAWSCTDGDVAGTICTASVSTSSGSMQLGLQVIGAPGATIDAAASIADDGTNGADPVTSNNSASASTPIVAPQVLPPASPTPTGSPTASPGGGGGGTGGSTGGSTGGTTGGPPCPADETCSAPTMSVDPDSITAGRVSHITGTARPGTVVTLHAYSRPSTTYAVIRSAVADPAGDYAFTVAPTTNTRLFAQTRDGASPSAVVFVHRVVSLAVASLPSCGLSAAGSVYPRRPGVPVTIEYRAADGHFVRAMSTATRSDGTYSVGRTFGACDVTMTWRASTPNTLVNMSGVSPLRIGRLAH